MLDAIDVVTDTQTRFSGFSDKVRAIELPDNLNGSYFLSTFGRPQGLSVCECERSSSATLAQQLYMLNSPEIMEKVRGSRAINLSKDKKSPEERIRELFRVAMSREPRANETATLVAYLDARLGTSKQDETAAQTEVKPKEEAEVVVGDADVRIVSIATDAKAKGDTAADRAFDGNAKTRWSINGKGHWIQFELSHVTPLKEIQAGFHKGERRYYFDLAFSADGKKWTKPQRFESSGKGDGIQSFKFETQKAKFVRMTHQGNSTGNGWANLHTLQVPGVETLADQAKVEVVEDSGGGGSKQSGQKARSDEVRDAYADIIWVLINTKEFQFNH